MPTWSTKFESLHQFQLFVDWLWFLIEQTHEVQQSGDGAHHQTLDLKCGSKVAATFDIETNTVTVESDLDAALFKPLLITSLQNATAYKVGDPIWWQGYLETPKVGATAAHLHMMRTANQHQRFDGTWRLGGDAVVTFTQTGTEAQLSFPPLFASQEIWLRFRVVGIGKRGPAMHREATQKFASLRAVLSLITASALDSARPMIVPASQEISDQAEAIRRDDRVQNLGVEGFAVWSYLVWQGEAGAYEAFDRSLYAMNAFAFGLVQPTVESATMFFVTAIEALSTPDRPWRTQRVTARFSEFLMYLCRDKLQETLKHANFKEVFGECRTEKKLAQLLYKLRSKPAHSGNFGVDPGFPGWGSTTIYDRPAVMLMADIARTAIIRFLIQPASSLCGHPNFDEGFKLELTSSERSKLFERADAQNISVQQVIRDALEF